MQIEKGLINDHLCVSKVQARRKRGAAGAAIPSPLPPTFCLKEILFTLQFLNEEFNSFHSCKKHRFDLL